MALLLLLERNTMKAKEFSEWLKAEAIFSNDKQINDCISRVRRFERAFAAYDIDLDDEIEKDGGLYLLSVTYHEGHNEEHKKFPDLDLPFERESRIIGMVNNAAKKYIVFRCTTENMHIDEISTSVYTRIVYRNYLRKKAE